MAVITCPVSNAVQLYILLQTANLEPKTICENTLFSSVISIDKTHIYMNRKAHYNEIFISTICPCNDIIHVLNLLLYMYFIITKQFNYNFLREINDAKNSKT